MMPASDGRTALYCDILTEDIDAVEVQRPKSSKPPSSSMNPHTVVLFMAERSHGKSRTNLHRNGLGLQVSYVGITFETPETAEDVRNFIGARKAARRILQCSTAEDLLDVSQPLKSTLKDQDIAENYNESRQNIVNLVQRNDDGVTNPTFYGKPLTRGTDVVYELDDSSVDKWQVGVEAIEDAPEFREPVKASAASNNQLSIDAMSSKNGVPLTDQRSLREVPPGLENSFRGLADWNEDSTPQRAVDSTFRPSMKPLPIDSHVSSGQRPQGQSQITPIQDMKKASGIEATSRSRMVENLKHPHSSGLGEKRPTTVVHPSEKSNDKVFEEIDTRFSGLQTTRSEVVQSSSTNVHHSQKCTTTAYKAGSSRKVSQRSNDSDEINGRGSSIHMAPSIYDIEDTSDDLGPPKKKVKPGPTKHLPALDSKTFSKKGQVAATSAKSQVMLGKQVSKLKLQKSKPQPLRKPLNLENTRRAAARKANERIHDISLGKHSAVRSAVPRERGTQDQENHNSQTEGSTSDDVLQRDSSIPAPCSKKSSEWRCNTSGMMTDAFHNENEVTKAVASQDLALDHQLETHSLEADSLEVHSAVLAKTTTSVHNVMTSNPTEVHLQSQPHKTPELDERETNRSAGTNSGPREWKNIGSIASKLSSALSGLPTERSRKPLSKSKQLSIKSTPQSKLYGGAGHKSSERTDPPRRTNSKAQLTKGHEKISEPAGQGKNLSIDSISRETRNKKKRGVAQTRPNGPVWQKRLSPRMVREGTEGTDKVDGYQQAENDSVEIEELIDVGQASQSFKNTAQQYSTTEKRKQSEGIDISKPVRQNKFPTMLRVSDERAEKIAIPRPTQGLHTERSAMIHNPRSYKIMQDINLASPLGYTPNFGLKKSRLPDDDTIRKPSMIGFGQKGPRNQGRMSTTKYPTGLIRTGASIQIDASQSPEENDEQEFESGIWSAVSPPHTPRAEGRKGLYIPPLELSPALETDFQDNGGRGPERFNLSKDSSSHATVNKYGSPIQSRQNSRRITSGLDAMQLIDQVESEYEPLYLIQAGNMDNQSDKSDHTPARTVQSFRASPTSPKHHRDEAFPSRNRKHIPSSPHEPSHILEDISIHRQQPEGSYVNLDTASVVKPLELPDPFSTDNREASSFVEKLHASVVAKPGLRSRGNRDWHNDNPTTFQYHGVEARVPFSAPLPDTIPKTVAIRKDKNQDENLHMADPYMRKSFIKRLRATVSDAKPMQRSIGNNDLLPESQHKLDANQPSELEDPDQTLVDASPKRVSWVLPDPRDDDESPESSSSENDESSETTIQSSERSVKDPHQQWLDSLRPDQERTLQSLYELSNVPSSFLSLPHILH